MPRYIDAYTLIGAWAGILILCIVELGKVESRLAEDRINKMFEYLKERKGEKMTDDLISRQAAIEVVHHTIYEFFDVVEDDEESPLTYKDTKLLELNKTICARVKDLPPAPDVVEVVRCKDCKYFAGEGMYCANNFIPQFDHFYCYDGERKEDEEST